MVSAALAHNCSGEGKAGQPPKGRWHASILARPRTRPKFRAWDPKNPRCAPEPTDQHMPKDVILTPEGLESLRAELEHMSTVRRREVAARIRDAREFGDISENAEYDDAKNEQAMLEARIAVLEEKLRSATVIDASELDNEVVRVGSTVHVVDADGGERRYTIVGSAEAKPAQMKLSNESPVGKALLGRRAGDTVSVATPRGERKLKIAKIEVA
jgi:transcription elongation factor GreA